MHDYNNDRCRIKIRVWTHKGQYILPLLMMTLLALWEGNPPVTSEFPSQRPVTCSFDVFFDLCLNKQLSKQSRRWWCEMPPHSLRHHWNVISCFTGMLHDEIQLYEQQLTSGMSFLRDRQWIRLWIRLIPNELDIAFHEPVPDWCIFPFLCAYKVYFILSLWVLGCMQYCHDYQRWKFPQVCQSEADNFGGGLGTFCWFFFNFMFMICDSSHEELKLFWLSVKHWWLSYISYT